MRTPYIRPASNRVFVDNRKVLSQLEQYGTVNGCSKETFAVFATGNEVTFFEEEEPAQLPSYNAWEDEL